MPYQQKVIELKKRLVEKSENLKTILSDYETLNVADYEIERCIRTLDGLHKNDNYLSVEKKIDSAAVMLPSNLPLYSLLIFALIPSLLCKRVNVRPNAILQEYDTITRIYNALELESIFPEVNIINQDHAGFRLHLMEANLVVFTGKPTNAEKILNEMKTDSLLVINGAGHNPLVVTDTADVEKAVQGALLVKGFNGGQDCAGPDAILVHSKVAKEFIKKFQDQFLSLKTGLFQNSETIIGPIHRFTELQRLSAMLNSNSKDITSGGMIDYKNSIVYPTTVVRGLERYPNFKETYGPIAFIHPYKCDKDLTYYFQDIDGQYNSNRMYVTVYGKSEYISTRDDAVSPGKPGNVGIILYEQTIHDVEMGYNPYGGYSMGASGLIKKSSKGIQRSAGPILLPEIIVEYLICDKSLPCRAKEEKEDGVQNVLPSTKKGTEIIPVIEEFKIIANETFGTNLLFGFVFGSAAKGKLKVQGDERDDLDTFICLVNEDQESIDQYHRHLVQLHKKYNLKVDETFPSEIMTLDNLKKAIIEVDKFDVSLDNPINGKEYDRLFWVHALSDKKTGFIGDGRALSLLIKSAQPNIYRWREQILAQLKTRDILPEHLDDTFTGLSKAEVHDKLSKLSPHLVVHLGLNYANTVTQVEPKKLSASLKSLQISQGFFAPNPTPVTNLLGTSAQHVEEKNSFAVLQDKKATVAGVVAHSDAFKII